MNGSINLGQVTSCYVGLVRVSSVYVGLFRVKWGWFMSGWVRSYFDVL